jgi:hypothetical protein
MQMETRVYSVIVKIKRRVDNVIWSLTGVYGLQREPDKICFMQELKLIWQNTDDQWLLLGDFNLRCRANDKSRGTVNRRILNRFISLLDEVEVKEVHLQGRRYTWSRGTANPTQTEIVQVFVGKCYTLTVTYKQQQRRFLITTCWCFLHQQEQSGQDHAF